jgi:hypothetical protein
MASTVFDMTFSDERLRDLHAFYAGRVADQDAQHRGYGSSWAALSARVLEHGGVAVVPPLDPEPHVSLLLESGFVRDGAGRLELGEPSHCHSNTASLFMDGSVTTIVTGYALSSDGLWRPHTWGIDAHDVLVETTERRCSYFGVALDGEDAICFVANELGHATAARVAVRSDRVGIDDISLAGEVPLSTLVR